MKEYTLEHTLYHRVDEDVLKELKIEENRIPDFCEYIKKREILPKKSFLLNFFTVDDFIPLCFTAFLAIFGFVIFWTIGSSLVDNFGAINAGFVPRDSLEESFIKDLPSFLYMPIYLGLIFIFGSIGIEFSYIFIKLLRGDRVNKHRVNKAEKYLATEVDEAVAITKRDISDYIEPKITTEGYEEERKIHLKYKLNRILPSWRLDRVLTPFIRKSSVLGITGALAFIGWGISIIFISVSMWDNPDHDITGTLVLFVLFGIFPLWIGFSLSKSHIFDAGFNIWKYSSIRKAMIEEQKEYISNLNTHVNHSSGDLEVKIDLLNAYWTLQELKNNPKLFLPSYFKIWTLIGVLFTLAGFFV